MLHLVFGGDRLPLHRNDRALRSAMNGPARSSTSIQIERDFSCATRGRPSGIRQQLSETVHDGASVKGARTLAIAIGTRLAKGLDRRVYKRTTETKQKGSIMKRLTITGSMVFVALVAAPALAQTNGNGAGPGSHQTTVEGSLSTVPVAPTGLGLQLGGGVTGV